jgi:Cullin, a subunit of E3 ubiquitin ligase
LKKALIGLLICFAMSICATAPALGVPGKQFILTRASYPIFVNGVEYKDEQLPALNYEGKTYIPLSKIGDILGVEYRWNAEKRRVEIGGVIKDRPPATANTNNAGSSGPNVKKQFILTKASYPIFVNGVEYKDEQLPALNYEGKTYIPLSKIGDILGVEYRWNAEKKRVEIGGVMEENHSASAGNGLYVTEGTGKYARYKMLHGYPDQDKYQIYFQVTSVGGMEQYHITYEDLRGIDLNERITWKYNGQTYTHTRSQLYVFFSETDWFRNNLSGIGQYTLTHDWFVDVFGDVYLEWAEGIGFSTDASRWVNEYFLQTAPQDPDMPYVTLTPDAKVIPVEENQPEEPSVDEMIRNIEKLYEEPLTEEEKQFHAKWINRRELKEKYEIEVIDYLNTDTDPASLELWFRKYNEKNRSYETIHKIDQFPGVSNMEAGQVLTNNGIRYMYYEGNSQSGEISNKAGLYFNREDLRKLGIIP